MLAAVHGWSAHAAPAAWARATATLPVDVPVDPDATTARELLRDELSSSIYHQGPSLVERFLTWLKSLFEGLSMPGVSGAWAAVVVVAVAGVVTVLALVVSGPLRRTRTAARTAVLDADDTRTADELVSSAAQAAEQGDFSAAVLDSFRALVRRAEERALVDPAPGRTALEAAGLLAVPFPAHAPALSRAASTFDLVHYGELPAQRETWFGVRDLEADLASTRPALAASASPVGTAS